MEILSLKGMNYVAIDDSTARLSQLGFFTWRFTFFSYCTGQKLTYIVVQQLRS